MADLRKLKDRAAELVAKGRLDKAAQVYREALHGDPGDAGTRLKLAEVLRRTGHLTEAIGEYQAVADRFARDGLLLKAIALSKTILELEPAHEETQVALAELYARRAAAEGSWPRRAVSPDALAPGGPGPGAGAARAATRPADDDEGVIFLPLAPPPRPEPVPLDPLGTPIPEDRAALPPTDFARIVSAAGAALEAGVTEEAAGGEEVPQGEPGGGEGPPPVSAAGTEAPSPPPAEGPLPRVPIFSDLTRAAFVALTRAMTLRRVAAGEVVLREGEAGTSFYVVATGRLAVSRRDERGDPVVLGRLGEGDFFGEMALLSGATRAATVVAEESAELLEFQADVLRDLARRYPHVAGSLGRFYRQRLLANALAVSPIFRPFPKGDRKLLVERFRARPVAAGEVVVREGDLSDGLYVVLDGAVEVVKRKDAQTVVVARLREGDLFGEMSCLRKAPASASVVVRRGGTLLRLPRREFDEIVSRYPQILELVSELSDERGESLDAILSGHAQWTEDGLVLI